MVSVCRAGLGAGLLLLSILSSAPARAAGGVAKWTEWHAVGDDATLTIDRAGKARIEHALRYRIVMGPLKQLELTGIEKNASLVSEATVTSEDGHELTAHIEPKGDGALHLTVDEPKGLKRGMYTFHLQYDVDLIEAKELVRDGAMWRLNWRSPVAHEGYDAAHVLLRVPAAQTEPRRAKTGPVTDPGVDRADPEGADDGGEDGVVAVLHRTADKDELELLRPHVSRGESPLWAARLDPKAFPEVRGPEMRPPPPPAPPEPNRVREVVAALGLLAVALLVGALVRTKLRAFAAACTRAGVTPSPLVPVAPWFAGAVAGTSVAGGVFAQTLGFPNLGAALVAVAMIAGTSPTPRAKRSPRGPGRWLALRPDEALVPGLRETSALDIGTRVGKLTAFLALLGIVALAAASRAFAAEGPYFVVLDALALLPLFVTGRAAQLPPDPARDSVPLLGGAFRALKKDRALKVAPWARVPVGADRADELRLLVVPRASLPGLTGIELGVAWARTATGYAARPEVLVRVHDASDAAARLARVAPFARPSTGRRPEEKVIVLRPRLPGRAAAIALVKRLCDELVDRRVRIGGAWSGLERRLDRERTDRVPAAA